MAADVLDPLVRFLHIARRTCDGDADKFLVLTVIALRTTQHPDFRLMTPEQIATGQAPILPSLGVNIRSIAESLDIPKETVRRKVQDLVAAGWIVREGGGLHITQRGCRDLSPVRDELETLIARLHGVGLRLLQES